MKYLVENKPSTKEDNEIRMNPRCFALLQNHLPPKEQDPGSFIITCSIGKLDFKNDLADLGASISIMLFSMYKRLGIEKLKPININICDGGDLPINVEKYYWKSNNDSKREELEWENLSLNDWMRIRFGKVCKMTRERILKNYWRERFRDEEDDLDDNLEDLEECGEDKANTILGIIHEKLSNDWFNNTSKDEEDLEGILDSLKPRSYDGFINLDEKAYNKRRCRLLGMTCEEPTSILIEKAKVTRYTIGPEETYTKVKVLGVEKIPRKRDNDAAIRARLMKKIAQEGNN
uniref:Uncharacterized protein n=1 Tax=Tanacetum cinerariifolium TaxID=118510 RepID=A0A6L2L2G7_TANCI|nr:hypothetical protein [Tanacetum cinerariifolium]